MLCLWHAPWVPMSSLPTFKKIYRNERLLQTRHTLNQHMTRLTLWKLTLLCLDCISPCMDIMTILLYRNYGKWALKVYVPFRSDFPCQEVHLHSVLFSSWMKWLFNWLRLWILQNWCDKVKQKITECCMLCFILEMTPHTHTVHTHTHTCSTYTHTHTHTHKKTYKSLCINCIDQVQFL